MEHSLENQWKDFSPIIEKFFDWLYSIDWEKIASTFDANVQAHIEAARTLAMKGWTIPAWLGISDPITLCEMTGAELDERFTVAFTENNFQLLNERIEILAEYDELATWKPVLLEVRDSIIAGCHLIAVPALLTIMEGYAAKYVLKTNETNIYTLFSKAGLHEADGLQALPAVSYFVFLQKLFERSKFGERQPDRINRHWVLHGRSDCNWSQADAFRLINALETLHWLWEIQGENGNIWMSLLSGPKKPLG